MEKGAGKTQLRLLVTLDGSALGDEVIAHALKLATATAAEVRLFSVLAEKDLPYLSQRPLSDGTLPKQGERVDEARHRLTAEIQARMAEVASGFEDDGVKVSVDIDNGDPAELIIEAAHDFGSDLIMMATHGHSGIVEQLLGSVSAAVVRSGVAPVVLVRPKKAAST